MIRSISGLDSCCENSIFSFADPIIWFSFDLYFVVVVPSFGSYATNRVSRAGPSSTIPSAAPLGVLAGPGSRAAAPHPRRPAPPRRRGRGVRVADGIRGARTAPHHGRRPRRTGQLWARCWRGPRARPATGRRCSDSRTRSRANARRGAWWVSRGFGPRRPRLAKGPRQFSSRLPAGCPLACLCFFSNGDVG